MPVFAAKSGLWLYINAWLVGDYIHRFIADNTAETIMGPPPEPFIILTVIMLVLFALIITFLGAGVLIVARWLTNTM